MRAVRLDDSRSHLARAREFLEAAQVCLDLELFNAATANAVTSGISSKDAICLFLASRAATTDSHEDVVAELSRAGEEGKALAPTLSRLLRLGTTSQDLNATIAQAEASRAVEAAARLFEAAQGVVST
jgi:hypothetical protein